MRIEQFIHYLGETDWCKFQKLATGDVNARRMGGMATGSVGNVVTEFE